MRERERPFTELPAQTWARRKEVPGEAKIEAVEEREQRFEHQRALADLGLTFEEYLLKTEQPDVAAFMEAQGVIDIAEIPEKTRKTFEKIALELSERKNEAKLALGMMKKQAEKMGCENMGRGWFLANKGKESRGEIVITEKAGCLIIAPESLEDFAELVWSPGDCEELPGGILLHTTVPEDTYYTWKINRATTDDPLLDSSDYFSDSIKMPRAQISLIYINPNNSRQEDIVVHEQQHFFNSLVGMSNGLLTNPEKTVQDELIAYVRDGSSATQIESALSNEMYLRIFQKGTEAQCAARIKMKEEICSTLKEAEQIFNSKTARSMLAHHLMRVEDPRELPRVIRSLGKNYLEKQQRILAITEGFAVSREEEPYPIHLIPKDAQSQKLHRETQHAFRQFSIARTLLERTVFRGQEETQERATADYVRTQLNYQTAQQAFLEHTGMPERITANARNSPPPLPGRAAA